MLFFVPWSILPPVATRTLAGSVELGRHGACPRTLQSGGNCWTMYVPVLKSKSPVSILPCNPTEASVP